MSELGECVIQEISLVLSGTVFASVLHSPLGLVGGAVVGGLMFLNEKPIEWVSLKLMNNSLAAKITSFVLSFFATTAINYFVVNALCFSISFIQILSLTSLTLLGAATLLTLIGLVKWVAEKIMGSHKAPITAS